MKEISKERRDVFDLDAVLSENSIRPRFAS